MRNIRFAFFTKSLNNTSFDTYAEEGWATAIRDSAQDPTAEVIIVRPEEWQPPVHKSIELSELRDVMNSFVFRSRWLPVLMKHGVSREDSVKCYEASTMLPFPDCEMVAFILTYTGEMQNRGSNVPEGEDAEWVLGCSAGAGSIIAAAYDKLGLENRGFIENLPPLTTENRFDALDYMMTTSAGRFDEEFLIKKQKPGLVMIDGRVIDLQAITSANTSKKRDIEAQAHFIEEQLKKGTAESKERFLLELTRETHENKHFFDYVSTTIGYELFYLNWNTIRFFFDLLTAAKYTGIDLKIPIKKWVNAPDCPAWANEFLQQYQNRKNFLDECSLGKITTFPLEQFPEYAQGKEYLSGLRLRESRGTRPYLGIPHGTQMFAYPIRIPDLLEAAAWNHQFITMNKIGGQVAADYWEKQRKERPSMLFPLHIVLAALYACQGVREDMSKMIDFSLLPPTLINGGLDPNLDAMQYDPPWRFYALWQYMIQNKSLNLENAIKSMCKDKKWMQPVEVAKAAHKRSIEMKEKLKRGQLALDPDSDLGLVLGDYLRYVERITSAREKTSLFGGPDDKKYMELIRDNEPPLHRMILSNGKIVFRENRAVHEAAWVDFNHLSHIMHDAVTKDFIKCPNAIGKEESATIPGNGECICRLGRDRCYISEFFEKLGVKVERLVG